MKISQILYWIAFFLILAVPVLVALYLYSSFEQSTGNGNSGNSQGPHTVTHIEDVCI
ncbi:hypothetical protein GCM10009001_08470 [Virgibacillus siamensis]|uniref:Tumor necrosis factor receptor superfamily member 19 n=1 Tax=Virgibacillus siamensis TaxID=480071 RepID=A0ABP3QS16_9BACI